MARSPPHTVPVAIIIHTHARRFNVSRLHLFYLPSNYITRNNDQREPHYLRLSRHDLLRLHSDILRLIYRDPIEIRHAMGNTSVDPRTTDFYTNIDFIRYRVTETRFKISRSSAVCEMQLQSWSLDGTARTSARARADRAQEKRKPAES